MTGHRDLWVVDVETTGLDPALHVPVEVAAVNVRTGEVIEFVPHLSDEHLGQADREALTICGYFERRLWERASSPPDTFAHYSRLLDLLYGQVLGGANPRFDADMLGRGFLVAAQALHYYDAEWNRAGEPWHYRLQDLQNYAAGRLRMPLGQVPSLHQVCTELGVENTAPHTALGDARATAECFRRLAAAEITTHPQDTQEDTDV